MLAKMLMLSLFVILLILLAICARRENETFIFLYDRGQSIWFLNISEIQELQVASTIKSD